MREIKLTQGYTALVSNKDYRRVSSLKFLYEKEAALAYTRRAKVVFGKFANTEAL